MPEEMIWEPQTRTESIQAAQLECSNAITSQGSHLSHDESTILTATVTTAAAEIADFRGGEFPRDIRELQIEILEATREITFDVREGDREVDEINPFRPPPTESFDNAIIFIDSEIERLRGEIRTDQQISRVGQVGEDLLTSLTASLNTTFQGRSSLEREEILQHVTRGIDLVIDNLTHELGEGSRRLLPTSNQELEVQILDNAANLLSEIGGGIYTDQAIEFLNNEADSSTFDWIQQNISDPLDAMTQGMDRQMQSDVRQVVRRALRRATRELGGRTFGRHDYEARRELVNRTQSIVEREFTTSSRPIEVFTAAQNALALIGSRSDLEASVNAAREAAAAEAEREQYPQLAADYYAARTRTETAREVNEEYNRIMRGAMTYITTRFWGQDPEVYEFVSRQMSGALTRARDRLLDEGRNANQLVPLAIADLQRMQIGASLSRDQLLQDTIDVFRSPEVSQRQR